MRLLSADFHGYKRLKNTSINLDADVVAIVGPNEAGKTSLLRALSHLSIEAPFEPKELTRRSSLPSDHRIVEALFEIDDGDRVALASIPESRSARWFHVAKQRDGQLLFWLSPDVRRDPTNRSRAQASLSRAAALKWARDKVIVIGDDDETEEAPLANLIASVTVSIDLEVDTLDAAAMASLDSLAEHLSGDDAPVTARRAAAEVTALIEAESSKHPRSEAIAVLRPRVPAILLFDLASRTLESEYDLEDLDPLKPPPALANLAALAGLDLAIASASVAGGEYGDKLQLIKDANDSLAKVFLESWGQSATVVQIDQDETRLRIFVSNPGGGFSAIEERSDGLRAFVALRAFTARYGSPVPPVLLVDEAETHLHYEAQADLVRVFSTQTAAAKIVYTTHSAGCLPEDLGTGIRLLEPTPSGDESVVRNSFWAQGGGFASLLLGMGASALAFSATRYALIAEGGVDLMLLPTLFREATGVADIGFQVAPGLAEATSDAVAELDLEAARVAYVVDDDDSGRDIRTKLIRAGIPKGRVLQLGRGSTADLVLEDLLDAGVYRDAVNKELDRSHGPGTAISLKDVSRTRRPAALAAWAKAAKIRAPNRTAVAKQVLAMRNERQLLSSQGKATVNRLFLEARRVLGLPL